MQMVGKGKGTDGKGRVMDMGGGLYMREGSNIYNSTVANRAMLIQTQFYDGRRYCKGHGKGDLLNHDLCELAGTPVVMHRDERLVAERAARKAAEKADRERKAAEKAAQEAAEKAAREAAAKAHREAASSSTGLVDGWRDPVWVHITNELEQKASQPGAAEKKTHGSHGLTDLTTPMLFCIVLQCYSMCMIFSSDLDSDCIAMIHVALLWFCG